MSSLPRSVANLDARHRVVYSLIASGVVFFASGHSVEATTRWLCAWDAFAISVIVLAWIAILGTPQSDLRLKARAQDVSSTVMFVFAILGACGGLFAVALLFHTNKSAAHPHLLGHLLLSLIGVVSAWSLVHTVFSLRYAHTFYGDHPDPKLDEHAAGLLFPEEPEPNYLDFAYFSFVIGMTFQVSDVQVTSRNLRRLVLIHGVLSFAFNTVILALTINTLSTLL